MTRKAELCSWVMEKVDRWKDQRDTAWQALWSEYYRLWRGRWIKEDQTRNSERSRIVTPALAQALEMTVAELIHALQQMPPDAVVYLMSVYEGTTITDSSSATYARCVQTCGPGSCYISQEGA